MIRWSQCTICLFYSPYSRNFSQATNQTTTGISSYLTSMSPNLDQQQIMWPVTVQNDEFMTSRGGKLPEFQRFTSNFTSQVKNSHYNSTSFCSQVNCSELLLNWIFFLQYSNQFQSDWTNYLSSTTPSNGHDTKQHASLSVVAQPIRGRPTQQHLPASQSLSASE